MFAFVKSIIVISCLAASAMAQNIAIGAPAPESTITSGQSLIVQVNKPDTLTSSEEVGIAICLQSCGGPSCDNVDVTEALGDVLYTGTYNPQFQSGSWDPTQNFTVTVPSGLTSGDSAMLSVAHLVLIGAGPYPYVEVVNTTLIVA